MRVGKWFNEREFMCPCCGKTGAHPRLVEILDLVREKVGVGIRITSGLRCKKHNAEVGGRSSSLHLPRDGITHAADFTYAAPSSKGQLNITRLYMLAESLARPTDIGIGLYPTWVHLDVRGLVTPAMKPARWDKFPWPRLG